MPRLKLTIEYAGTRYSGWQIQKNARTVQGEIDAAVRRVTGRHDFELYGSGRTDAGVHASGQVAHLDIASGLPAETLRLRINDELPADINVLDARLVSHRFHARHDAVARRYVYQIARRRTAFAKPFVWWVKEPLDADRMREVASGFVGMHDFSAFSAAHAPGVRRRAADDDDEPSSLVQLERVEFAVEGSLLLIGIDGSHFLWKMVRRLVGVLVAVGRGDLPRDTAANMLRGASDLPARLTAPASGLFLDRVFYKGDPREVPLRAPTPIV